MGGQELGDGVEMSLGFRRRRFSQRLYLDAALLECFYLFRNGSFNFHLAFLNIYQIRKRCRIDPD